MRITNQLHFTENHRYIVSRHFSLSSMDRKMLASIYQPMVGAFAISVYATMYAQLSEDQFGCSHPEQQRKLFLTLDLEPGERGRKFLIEQASKLEAVGLLHTLRKYMSASDDYLYEYQLQPPLSPAEFYETYHLVLLLRDKVGKYAVISLRDQFYAPVPVELDHPEIPTEDISIPFYELFRLNSQIIDHELEQALYESAPTREAVGPRDAVGKRYEYGDIIIRFPRESLNRAFVEQLRYKPEQLAEINFIAGKYQLSLQETCRLLDEDGVFLEDGSLHEESFQYRANLYYRQSRKRDAERERMLHKTTDQPDNDQTDQLTGLTVESKTVEMQYCVEVPALFLGQYDIIAYNTFLRNEPYTHVLQRFFPKGKIPDRVLDIFEKIDLNYKLSEEVINVLIHYLHVNKDSSWTKSYIDSIVSDMMGKQVGTFEQAVGYVRDEVAKRSRIARKTTDKPQSNFRSAAAKGQKPKLPLTEVPKGNPMSTEKLAALREKAKKLEGQK